MVLDQLLHRSSLLMQNMWEVLGHPIGGDSGRVILTAEYAVLSLEHCAGVRCLLESGNMSSAPILLRCQFESLIRSVWIGYCAPQENLGTLGAAIDGGPDQKNASLPNASKMLDQLEQVPEVDNVVLSLREFQSSSWKPLNSYVHAGDHPLWRQANGYPIELAVGVLRQSNGLALLAAMQMAILTGVPGLQRAVLELDGRFRDCLPPHSSVRESHDPLPPSECI